MAPPNAKPDGGPAIQHNGAEMMAADHHREQRRNKKQVPTRVITTNEVLALHEEPYFKYYFFCLSLHM